MPERHYPDLDCFEEWVVLQAPCAKKASFARSNADKKEKVTFGGDLLSNHLFA